MDNDRYVLQKKLNVAAMPDPSKNVMSIPDPSTIRTKVVKTGK